MAVCLVAGAAGFLGSNLSSALLDAGHTVVGLDNFSTSTNRNLISLSKRDGFRFIQEDVSIEQGWPELGKIDKIFHLASPASPPKYMELGLETIRANTIGTENLIRLAVENNARFLFTSTSEVYGDPSISPQAEGYWGNVNPVGPRSVYDESKRLGETITDHYIRNYGLNGSIVRIFNTYGPGMDPFDGRVVSTFIRQAIQGEPLTVFGSGTQTRSFCYVDDLISGIIKMAESSQRGPINIGNPVEIDLIQLGETIGQVLGLKVEFEFHVLPEDDPKQRCPDITLATTALGWQPQTSLHDGIVKTYEWIRDQMKTA